MALVPPGLTKPANGVTCWHGCLGNEQMWAKVLTTADITNLDADFVHMM